MDTAEQKLEEVALVVREAGSFVGTRQAMILADALKSAAEQRRLLVAYVRHHMKENVDYGTIPGTPKPSLWKAGAEKLTELYRCAPKFSIMEKTVDWEKGFFHYTFRCRLESRDSRDVLAEGFGSCSSRETKYRWRDSKPKCPKCGKETIFRSKNAGEGFYCWRKKDGCGATFVEKDPSIVSQAIGKTENPDIADQVNTILKMAKKRAHVDGAIALAGCSDLFTQDLEDLPEAQLAPEGLPPPQSEPQERPKSRAHAVAQEMRTKQGPIIDVKPGETEEIAAERASRPYASMTDQALSVALDDARQRVQSARVGTKLHEALTERFTGLEAELDVRMGPA